MIVRGVQSRAGGLPEGPPRQPKRDETVTTIAMVVNGLRGRDNVIKAFRNTGWLVGEKVIQVGLGVLVSILVARHLGPQRYGLLSYAFSVVGFLATLVYLGLSGLVARDIVRQPGERHEILGTVFAVKTVGGLVAVAIAVVLAFATHAFQSEEFWLLLVAASTLFARPFETFDLWFQSQVQSKYAVFARTTAFAASALTRVILVFAGASLLPIAIAMSLQEMLVALLLAGAYAVSGQDFRAWRTALVRARGLLGQSWQIMLGGLFALANFKCDQIMLRWLGGSGELGIYSVAVQFSEIWYFIPGAICASVFPRLVELKGTSPETYSRRLQQLFDISFAISMPIALATMLVAGPVILLLFGPEYSGAATVLIVHIWAGVFMFNHEIICRWVLIENRLAFHLLNHGGAAVLNVVLNLVFIPAYGAVGAAISTICSYAACTLLFLFLYGPTRGLALMILKSYALPLRAVAGRLALRGT